MSLIPTGEASSSYQNPTINNVKPLRQHHRFIDVSKPSQQEVDECTARTKIALETVLNKKLGRGKASSSSASPTFIKYKSSNMLNNTTSERIIKIVDVKQDPMAPPKFKQKKQVLRPPSPPAPILHAPQTTKVTAQDQKDWYIPPSVSNWKNPNGYTISLDKRLAVDGRDPTRNQTKEINKNLVSLSSALDEADREIRKEIKIRNMMKNKLAEKETLEKEEKLRQLAEKARQNQGPAKLEDKNERLREIIRNDRKRAIEKEFKVSKMGHEQKLKKLLSNRDVSHRTQLGLAKPTNSSVESQFDSNLFKHAVSKDTNQIYDNPLFVQQAINSIYKTNTTAAAQMGGEDEAVGSGPIEFEKEQASGAASNPDSDTYGLQDASGSSNSK